MKMQQNSTNKNRVSANKSRTRDGRHIKHKDIRRPPFTTPKIKFPTHAILWGNNNAEPSSRCCAPVVRPPSPTLSPHAPPSPALTPTLQPAFFVIKLPTGEQFIGLPTAMPSPNAINSHVILLPTTTAPASNDTPPTSCLPCPASPISSVGAAEFELSSPASFASSLNEDTLSWLDDAAALSCSDSAMSSSSELDLDLLALEAIQSGSLDLNGSMMIPGFVSPQEIW